MEAGSPFRLLAFAACVGVFAGGVRYVSNQSHFVVTGISAAALACAVGIAFIWISE